MGQQKILIKVNLHKVIKNKKNFHYKELGQGGEHYKVLQNGEFSFSTEKLIFSQVEIQTNARKKKKKTSYLELYQARS